MRLVTELPDELHRRVKVKAAQEGVPIAGVVRAMLQSWVDTKPRKVEDDLTDYTKTPVEPKSRTIERTPVTPPVTVTDGTTFEAGEFYPIKRPK